MSALLRGFPLLRIATYMAHVIEDRDAEKLASRNQSYCQYSVFLGRLRLTARMVMSQYDSGSIAQYRWLKNLARMHDRRCETADTHRIDANNAILLIKENDGEMLPIHIGKVRMQQRCCVNSTANLLVVAGYSPFPY